MLRFIILFILFIGTGLNAQSQTSLDCNKVRNEVIKELKRCEDGWNKGSLEDYMLSYWKSDSIRFAGNNNYRFGWNKVLETYKKSFSTRELMGKLTFSELDVTPITDKDAMVFGRFTVERKNENLTGLFTLLVKKFGDNWRIVHDHSSSER